MGKKSIKSPIQYTLYSQKTKDKCPKVWIGRDNTSEERYVLSDKRIGLYCRSYGWNWGQKPSPKRPLHFVILSCDEFTDIFQGKLALKRGEVKKIKGHPFFWLLLESNVRLLELGKEDVR